MGCRYAVSDTLLSTSTGRRTFSSAIDCASSADTPYWLPPAMFSGGIRGSNEKLTAFWTATG